VILYVGGNKGILFLEGEAETGVTVRISIDGTWKYGTPYVCVGGQWKAVSEAKVAVAGAWKNVE